MLPVYQFYILNFQLTQLSPIQPHAQTLHLPDRRLALLAQVAIRARDERVHMQCHNHIRAGRGSRKLNLKFAHTMRIRREYADSLIADKLGEGDWRSHIEGAWLVQAHDSTGVVGSVGLGSHWEPERAHTATLFGMYVAPRVRGQGVGAALVDAVLSEARHRGKDRVVLEVAEVNAPAIALYGRCGFVRTGVTHPHPRRADLSEVEMEHVFAART